MEIRRGVHRRADDIEPLVRSWVGDGRVRPAVAARFLALRRTDETEARLRWEASGRPQRRVSDR